MQLATTKLRNGTSTHDQEGWSRVPPSGGPAVVEVVATYRGTVLDVQQVAAGRRSSSSTWVVAGSLISVVGLGLFVHAVQSTPERAAAQATHVVEEPSQRGVERYEEDLRSTPRGFDLGSLGAALALLGLVPFVAGVSGRRKHAPERYTIGQAHGVSFPAAVEHDDGALPLVRLLGDEVIVAFTPEMTGTVDTTLGRETVAGLHGRHRTSVPLRAGGQAQLELGDLAFTVRPSTKEHLAVSRRTIDRPALWSQVCSLAILGSLFISVSAVKHNSPIDLDDLVNDDYTTMLVSKLEAPLPKTAAEQQVDKQVERARKAPKHKPKPKRTPKPKPEQPETDLAPPVGPKLAKAIKKRRRGDSQGLDAARKSGVMSVEDAWEAADEMVAISEESAKVYMPNASDDELWQSLKASPVDTSGGMILELKSTGRGGGGDARGAVDLRRENVLAMTGMGGNRAVDRHVGDDRAKFDAPKQRDRSGAREKLMRKHPAGSAVSITSGGRDKSAVYRVANNHGPALRTCQDRAKRLRPRLAGKLSVTFEIAADGSVEDVDIVRNTTKARMLGGCVARVVRGFRFGAGDAARVTYTMQVQ